MKTAQQDGKACSSRDHRTLCCDIPVGVHWETRASHAQSPKKSE